MFTWISCTLHLEKNFCSPLPAEIVEESSSSFIANRVFPSQSFKHKGQNKLRDQINAFILNSL